MKENKNPNYKSDLIGIGEPTREDLEKTFDNKVPVQVMPHRNLRQYLTEDENGNEKIIVDPINKDEPINVKGLDKTLYDIDEKSIENRHWSVSVS